MPVAVRTMDEPEKTPAKVDKNILDLFWKLTDNKTESRIDACAEILCYLITKQNENLDTKKMSVSLSYCIERLVKGLASSRDSARLGFSLLLTQILKHFDVVELEDIFKLMKHLISTNKMEKDMVFGQLFAYSSIIRSGRLVNCSKISFVVLQLFDLWQGRNFILNASYQIVVDLFSQITSEIFKQNVWPDLKKRLAVPWDNMSADTIWLLLLCIRMFPDKVSRKYMEKHWGTVDVFAPENFDHLMKIIKQTSSCLPNLHPFCIEFLIMCRSRKDSKVIWKALIDECLLESDQTEKHRVAFEMVKRVLEENPKKKMLKRVLSPKFCLMFTRSLINIRNPMNPAAVTLAKSMLTLVKTASDPNLQMLIVGVFLESLGSLPSDQIFNRAEFRAIIQSLLPDTVKAFCEILKSVAVCEKTSSEEENTENSFEERKRMQMVLQIGCMISHPAVVDDVEWRLSMVQFLFLHSFFTVETPTQEILHCEVECSETSDSLLEVFRSTFYRSINYLHQRADLQTPAVEQYIKSMMAILAYADTLMEAQTAKFSIEKVSPSWQQMKASVVKLQKQSKKHGKTAESNIFQALLLSLGFHLFHDSEHISDILEELYVCCKKAVHSWKHVDKDVDDDGEEPEWVCVVVDILLSLLSKSSYNLRVVVNFIFPLLCPFITDEALQQILTVVNPDQNNEESMLVDESDRESDIEFDSGDSSDGEESDSDDKNISKADEQFRKQVKEALGPAADDSDAESIVLSDSEMFKLDPAIAKAFEGRVQTGHTKVSEEKRTMMHFRLRCMDLVFIYLKSEPPMKMVLLCIPPLIATYEFGHMDKTHAELLQKATTTLQALTKIKKFGNIDNVTQSELEKLLETIIAKCHRETNMVLAKKLYSLCVFIVQCYRKLPPQISKTKSENPPSYVKLYLSALELFVKNSSMYPQFFVVLMETLPDLAPYFIHDCSMLSFNKDVRLFKRTQCMELLTKVLKYSKSEKDMTSKQWIEIGKSVLHSAIECLKETLGSSDMKHAFLIQLFEVIDSVNTIVTEKTKQSPLKEHKSLLPLLTNESQKLSKKARSLRRKLILALG